MIPAERQKLLLNLINQKDVVSITQLAESLNVSHMTIRRDIQKLEEMGKVVSISGGVKMQEHLSFEPTHQDKSLLFHTQKEQIGKFAAQQIPTNTTIYLDAGTTTLEIAYRLIERDDLLVVTNDFSIAHFLMTNGQCELIHIGGSVNKLNHSSVGELAGQFLRQLSIDIAFVSTSSWTLKGLTTPDENKLPVKKALLDASNQRILVSDSSKYGKVATFHICPLTRFDRIICDKNLVEPVQHAIKELNVELVTV
ncbi:MULTISPECIES: DeoR/GlpR family DNA-binding transcription regulator [Rodentibacter]|uniref:DeoR/GlpR family DNA-binding transcription regulator n=1 Tax=Rodentibacter pneumotropicus TaxID=758 RepID=A0A1V3JZ86_9PAST|nr:MULTISPECIES: DeoR/GlpR family DNA-binding transcription regulator [Pasteurellaceae]MCQ9122259.1 DeoR/GlpR family DNA-binding transcription regulator [Rodentibacter pneumotropicus]MDC2826398.1 DeoR/GlpR family DNA-binding transcription regulator [Rodentibacter pneumotropicus]OOF60898.1 DeoR family transcriptional regulator [Rodentibacter pneumotropicus]OOF65359.1 DeoR family transcriptional regulator [Rodentibacter pneumotropicus]OOF66189.1 DeoR family transcriptional regulator [Rodentibact